MREFDALPVVPPPDPARYGLPLRALTAEPIRIRTPDRGDAPAIAELLSAHSVAHYGEPRLTVAEIEHWLSLSPYSFWVAEAAGGELVAYADADEQLERTRYWMDLRALDGPAASVLLGIAEEWIAGRAAPDALARGLVPANDDVLRGVYEAAGYALVRYDLEMRIELDDPPPEPTWPDGVTVRTFRPGDDDERAWQAATEAFADHWEFTPLPFERWRQEILGQPAFDRSLVFLALDGDEIAGLAFCQIRDAGQPLGWVQILGVRRAWRRQGLGLALLRQAFRELRARGARRGGLEVDAENLTGAVRLYERAGMRIASQGVIYEKALG